VSESAALPFFPEAEYPQRRRRWPWIVTLVIVIALVVGAWFLAEAIARSIVTSAIRGLVTTNLELPPGQTLEVEVEGAVIPQLIGGSLDDVTIAADDIVLQGIAGDVTVQVRDVALNGSSMGAATATVELDADQLRTLMAQIEGFPASTLAIAEPDVTISTELSLLGVGIPVGVSLVPSASGGSLVLTPASIQVAGADVTADELRRQFGVLSNAVLRDWPVCVAQYLPAGLVLSAVHVTGDELVAGFDVSPSILSDPAMRARGTC